MNNTEFLEQITASFKKFLCTGSRSNEKLKILHGAIASDLYERLGKRFTVHSLGIGDGKEDKIQGRYINKAVDITISDRKKAIAGIGVKFVMQNYSQNSNNYFENMLGETANIRCNKIPYFQIFIIPDKLPYYDKDGNIKKDWEKFSTHNAEKYVILSNDNIDVSNHTPTKTLLFVISIPDPPHPLANREQYKSYYSECEDFVVSESSAEYGEFDNAVVFNDYEKFANSVVNYLNYLYPL